MNLTTDDVKLIAQIESRIRNAKEFGTLGKATKRATYEKAGVAAYVLDAVQWQTHPTSNEDLKMETTQQIFTAGDLEVIASFEGSIAFHRDLMNQHLAQLRADLSELGCPDHVLNAVDWKV